MSSNNSSSTRVMRRVRPLYGHGMSRVAVRQHHTLDLLEPATETQKDEQRNLRCEAIKQFLAGTRPTPSILDAELNAGTLLGSDDFDMQFEHGGLVRRCA